MSTPASKAHKFAYESTSHHRGLRNGVGENNCFLNVTIQALWHLGPFRTHLLQLVDKLATDTSLQLALRDLEPPSSSSQRGAPSSSSSLILALCNLFVQYEFTDLSVLPPDELRVSLGQLSADFEFGKIADANEALTTILERIHYEMKTICPHSMKCLSHATFGGMMLEQGICSLCGAYDEPKLRNDFLLYFQAAELISLAKENNLNIDLIPLTSSTTGPTASPPSTAFETWKRSRFPKVLSSYRETRSSFNMLPSNLMSRLDHHEEHVESNKDYHNDEKDLVHISQFGNLLQKSLMSVGTKSCPSLDDASVRRSGVLPCQGKASANLFCLEHPLALGMNIGWIDRTETAETLHYFYSMISHRLYLSDIFSEPEVLDQSRNVPPAWRTPGSTPTNNKEKKGPSYVFRGLVCYYGLHYVSIFEVLEDGDKDATFYLFDDQRVVRIGNWEETVRKCVASRYQAVLLLYELEAPVVVGTVVAVSAANTTATVTSYNPILSTPTPHTPAPQPQLAQPNTTSEPASSERQILTKPTEDHLGHPFRSTRTFIFSNNATNNTPVPPAISSGYTVVSPPSKHTSTLITQKSIENDFVELKKELILAEVLNSKTERSSFSNKLSSKSVHQIDTLPPITMKPHTAALDNHSQHLFQTEQYPDIELWSRKPKKYFVEFSTTRRCDFFSLGLELQHNEDGKLVVTDLLRDELGRKLPAEKNGVQLMDYLLNVNLVSVKPFTNLDDLLPTLRECDPARLEFQSRNNTELLYHCPQCKKINILSNAQEDQLKHLPSGLSSSAKINKVSIKCETCAQTAMATWYYANDSEQNK